MKKSYVVNLKYGTWKNQLWFMGSDEKENIEAFKKAEKKLISVSSNCKNSNEFFGRACAHFENHGFLRIQK